MIPVQLVLTDELAGLLAASADITIKAHEADQIVSLTDDELVEYKRLAVFMAMVASEPERFPLRESLARSLKKKVRAAKGPAQPKSGRKPKRSQGQQKRDRAEQRRQVEEFNAAREAAEQSQAAQQALLEERRAAIESEPKFNVTDILGNPILEGVPQSMIVALPAEAPAPAPAAIDQLILPPSVQREMRA